MKPIAFESADRADQRSSHSHASAGSKNSIGRQILGLVGVSALMLAPLTVLTTANSAVSQTIYRRSGGTVYYRNVGVSNRPAVCAPARSACIRGVGVSCGNVSVRQIGYRGLRFGDEGPAVVLLQQRLNQLRFFLTVDGVFGNETDDAVRRFQRGAGLPVTGIVGPETQQALLRGDYVASNTVGYRPNCNQNVGFPNPCNPVAPLPIRPLPVEPITPFVGGNRYFVLIPDSGDDLARVRWYAPQARLIDSPLGRYIQVGVFNALGPAETLNVRMRNLRFDSQIRYF
jgi:hypothetical protein